MLTGWWGREGENRERGEGEEKGEEGVVMHLDVDDFGGYRETAGNIE